MRVQALEQARREAEAERLAVRRAQALIVLADLASRYRQEARLDQWVLPISDYRLTGRFGDVSYLWSTAHTGLDFAAVTGTPIHAIARGVVVEAGWAGAYGYRTVVVLQDGTELWYCHQSSIDVSVGQVVGAGQVLGSVGSTGNVTGAHLHLEVRPDGGAPVDPLVALTEQGLRP